MRHRGKDLLRLAAPAAALLVLQERAASSPAQEAARGSGRDPGLTGTQPAPEQGEPSPSSAEATAPTWSVRGTIVLGGAGRAGSEVGTHLWIGEGPGAVTAEATPGKAFELVFDPPRAHAHPTLGIDADGCVGRVFALTRAPDGDFTVRAGASEVGRAVSIPLP